jgi:hypothetical protein
MLPDFLIEETTVRESGESAVFDASEHSNHNLLLTVGITHAVEQESIGIDIFGSQDGVSWIPKPIASLASKSYCGTYQLILPRCQAQYFKAVWRVKRCSQADPRPFFRFYLVAQPAQARTAAAGAA